MLGISAVCEVPDVPQQVAEVWIELAEHVVLSFAFTGSYQFVQQDTELLSLHECLSVRKVRARHTHSVHLFFSSHERTGPEERREEKDD